MLVRSDGNACTAVAREGRSALCCLLIIQGRIVGGCVFLSIGSARPQSFVFGTAWRAKMHDRSLQIS